MQAQDVVQTAKVIEIKENIVEVKGKINELEKNINIKWNQNITPIHAALPGSIESLPKFYGNNSINPITYIKNLKSIIENYPTESRKLQVVRASLKDSAQTWWDMISEDVQTFDDFETEFIKQYWGQTQQMRVRQDLLFGKYRVGGYESRESYIIKKYSIIRHLTPVISESDIVAQLTRHFDNDIVHAVALRGVDNIKQFLELVKKLDNIDMGERFRNNNNQSHNNQRTYEPVRSNYQQNYRTHKHDHYPNMNNKDRFERINGNSNLQPTTKRWNPNPEIRQAANSSLRYEPYKEDRRQTINNPPRREPYQEDQRQINEIRTVSSNTGAIPKNSRRFSDIPDVKTDVIPTKEKRQGGDQATGKDFY